jgi:hypothetical protein
MSVGLVAFQHLGASFNRNASGAVLTVVGHNDEPIGNEQLRPNVIERRPQPRFLVVSRHQNGDARPRDRTHRKFRFTLPAGKGGEYLDAQHCCWDA